MPLCRKCGHTINLGIEKFCTNCGFEINLNQYQNKLKNHGNNNPLSLAANNHDSSYISSLFYFIALISFAIMISIFAGGYYFHILSNPIIIIILIIAIITLLISLFIAGISDPNQDDYDY